MHYPLGTIAKGERNVVRKCAENSACSWSPIYARQPWTASRAKNRSTLVRGVLLRGDDERLLRKAIEMALNGDAQILKFFLGRILPRERVILLDLPKMEFADDATEALGVITSAVCEGKITPGEGASLTGLVNSFAHAVYMADLVKRLEALEAKINGTA